jgi:hypothetical protein
VRRYPPLKPKRTWRGTAGGSTRAWRLQRQRVLARDGYRCTWTDRIGERCKVTAPRQLEIHHLRPGLGLAAQDHDLTTRCPNHNPRSGG